MSHELFIGGNTRDDQVELKKEKERSLFLMLILFFDFASLWFAYYWILIYLIKESLDGYVLININPLQRTGTFASNNIIDSEHIILFYELMTL
jgi:hypothetical protein